MPIYCKKHNHSSAGQICDKCNGEEIAEYATKTVKGKEGKMNILCKLFGHKPIKGWGGGVPYGFIQRSVIDGMGIEHAYLYVECERCHKEFNIVKFHLPRCEKCKEKENK